MRRIFNVLSLLVALVALTSCYSSYGHRGGFDGYSERQRDSISFYDKHHYTNNYNFVVKSDSLVLFRQQPEEVLGHFETDSVVVHRHDNLVVADIRILPTDSIDSVWVQLARDQQTFGWTHESTLLSKVVPDDPISQFISTFSDIHLLIFLGIIVLVASAYLMRKIAKKNAKIVHFNDIDSFYPTLLAILVASAATFYASIQLFAPDTWRHFYYHPTLNPFSVPTILSIFLCSVWAMFIVAIAVVEDVRKQMPFGEAVLYLCGLAGVCAIDYIVFSITTLYYIGYILWTAYIFFALFRYWRYSRCSFLCGNCGAQLHRKGRCPYCGTWND